MGDGMGDDDCCSPGSSYIQISCTCVVELVVAYPISFIDFCDFFGDVL